MSHAVHARQTTLPVSPITEPGAHLERIAWLDGLRGAAAIQVVLLHYASAFVPGLGLLQPNLMRGQWEHIVAITPLFFVLNGYASVDLFFLLSGVALTKALSGRPVTAARWILRRIVRLGIPMAAAILFGAALLFLSPMAHRQAADITGSTAWLGAISPSAPSMPMIIHQILFEGMIAGYRDTSLLPEVAKRWLGLDALSNSFDAPLWTLHIEFVGSLLILALIIIRTYTSRAIYISATTVFSIVFITSPLILFVFGHLICAALLRRDRGSSARLVGLICLISGVLICSGRTFSISGALFPYLPQPILGAATTSYEFQLILGEVILFLGVSLTPAAQRVLARPAARWLGKISFSLYLVHFPILFTFISATFLHLVAFLPSSVSALICLCVGIPSSLAVAFLFQRWVDGPSISLSHRISQMAMGH
jgi:peptidoglycan/LPS O-acetylase OafA/YrhL